MAKKSAIEQHLQRWKDNRKYLECLDPSAPEWAVAVTFYTALHLVQAWLLRMGKHPASHGARNDVINRLAYNHRLSSTERQLIRQLATEYSTLREASIHARYDAEVTNYKTVSGVQTDVVDGSLAIIEGLVQKLMRSKSAVPNLGPVTLRSE